MFIYTNTSMFPSARALAQSLSTKTGSMVRVTAHPDTILSGRFIRWGNSSPIDGGQESYNSAELIGVAANKKLLSDYMVETGIPCVEIKTGIPSSYPVVNRRTLTGYGGSGITISRTPEDFYFNSRTSRHWSYFRNFSFELGIHIFNGRIIKLFKKVLKNEYGDEFPIRNSSRGYHFSLVNQERYPKLYPLVEMFYNEFPIMFGRMDVGWDCVNKIYRVIEMNTAPRLTNNLDTLEAYTNEFLDIL